ncbi:MAG TPA: DUF29 family protein [Parachlamydiaceae bacterium]|nr:DUF29 family protein [Parachlamydiaceae bacterium]
MDKNPSQSFEKKQISELDLNNLREEIESLGKNDKRSLPSQTTRLLIDLLKKKTEFSSLKALAAITPFRSSQSHFASSLKK